MELREGYKQTEVGVIPEDWVTLSYEKVFDFLKAATYSRAEVSSAGEFMYVHYGDIHTEWDGFVDFNTANFSFVTAEQAKAYSLLRNGDLIMADASEDYEGIGKSVEVRNLINQKAISGLHTFVLRDSENIIADGYRGYLHSNKQIKKQFDKLATGMKVFGVSRNNLKKVLIPLPPTKAEQKAIAEALSDADALIASLEQLIVKKRCIKQGAMQELLTGKRRLPGFSGDWEEKTVEEIAAVGRGRVISHKEIDRAIEPKYPVFSSQTSNNGVMGYLDTFEFEGKYITWTTDGANAGTVFARSGRFNCTNVCGTLKLLSGDSRFIAGALSRVSKSHVSKHLGNPKLMNDVMKKIEIRIPVATEEQAAIATMLSEMDEEIDILETKLSKARLLKQGMMQELLTGRIRLV